MLGKSVLVLCVVVVVVSANKLLSERGPFPTRPADCSECRLIQRVDIHTDVVSFGWIPSELVDDMSWRSDDWTDITEYYQHPVNNRRIRQAIPSTPSQQSIVRPLLPFLSQNYTRDTLEHLGNYNNRYYTSSTGVESALWIRDEMQRIADDANRADVKVELFEHTWAQPSVIATMVGTELPDEIVVIGAHIDSTAAGMPNGRAPGVDDDAAGFVAALDTYRVLVEQGFRPRRTVQFMGYAAEEVGLRGSQAIAQQYAQSNANVLAVWQSEMNGYVGDRREIMVTTPSASDVDFDLSTFATVLVGEYCDIGFYSTTVNGQSDHASWTNRGYRATCVAEAGPASRDLNPCIHRTCDTLDLVDISYVLEFNKLNLAFVVELGNF